jgi:hypothetical protein
LLQFYCHFNQLTGAIPDLSANTALLQFECQNNQLTGWDGGAVSATCTVFRAQNNLLPESAVNGLLQAFDAAGASNGTLDLGGTGNAPATGAGLTAKANLEARGWTVTVN